jgi:hypothetical protein
VDEGEAERAWPEPQEGWACLALDGAVRSTAVEKGEALEHSVAGERRFFLQRVDTDENE